MILRTLKKHQMTCIILLSISTPFILNDYLSLKEKIFFFSLSDLIRQVIIFLIPFFIFPYIINSIITLGEKGLALFFVITFGVLISNFFSIILPYILCSSIIPTFDLINIDLVTYQNHTLLFCINFPKLFSIEILVLFATILGFTLNFFNVKNSPFLVKYTKFSSQSLERYLPLILPLYIFGTLLETINKIDITKIGFVFIKMILVVIFIQAIYITFLFFIGSCGDLKKTFKTIKNALEPALVGFSTMSSLMTMPFTIKAAEKNTQDPILSKIIVSSTVNSHDIGECIFLSVTVLTVFYMYNASLPDLYTYSIFAITFAFAQFGGISIPGGGSIIIMPLLFSHLNFNAEMTSLVIILTLIMDPVSTANNVLGNSSFVIITRQVFVFITSTNKEKLFNYFQRNERL